jgi:hypothetical protein
MIDHPVFDEALPTRMLANREAHGPIGAPVRIEQDRVSGNLPGHMAEVWRGSFPT